MVGFIFLCEVNEMLYDLCIGRECILENFRLEIKHWKCSYIKRGMFMFGSVLGVYEGERTGGDNNTRKEKVVILE